MPLVLVPLVLASAVARFRRGTVVERQQMKWFTAAAALAGTCLACVPLLGPLLGQWTLIPALATLGLLPVAIGIAVLRYRLYEIDRIISRTISWALTTSLVAALFAGLIVALEALLAPVAQQGGLAVAGSTLVAAAAFQPLRHRIQSAVDHRFNRRRYDGERTFAAFADHLRGVTDLNEVIAGAVDAVDASLGPRSMAMWIRPTQEGTL